jgi:3-deoxy-D-manno-octulosonic-acid transferase
MFSLFYNFGLLLLLCIAAPYALWKRLRYGKYRVSVREKLRFSPPVRLTDPTIWVHAVSVGETRAAIPLLQKLHREEPLRSVVVSTTTETGATEAKRQFPWAAGHYFLPFDFSWSLRSWTNKLNTQLLIIVETDFWYHLLHAAPRAILINGKLSERSFRRFRFFLPFTRRLFAPLKLLCVQTAADRERFIALGIDERKIVITGNLKLDAPPPTIDVAAWRTRLTIPHGARIVVLGSTHPGEETLLIKALQPLLALHRDLHLIVVPRHPERRRDVEIAVASAGVEPRSTIVTEMGALPACYAMAECAIVGGSFLPGIGGHNVFEPVVIGTPVLFGPHMEGQVEIAALVEQGGAGKRAYPTEITSAVDRLLGNEGKAMRTAGATLVANVRGATERTWQAIQPFVSNCL